MIEQWLSDPSKVGATMLLLAAVIAFYKRAVMPIATHDAIIARIELGYAQELKSKDAIIAHQDIIIRDLKEEKKEFKAMVLRTVEVTDKSLTTAEKLAEKVIQG